jgi:hypothetical protein
MPSIKQVRKTTFAQLKDIISNGSSVIDSMENVLNTHFNQVSLSQVTASYMEKFMAEPDASNTSLLTAMNVYMDTLSTTISNIQTMERFLSLHIPKMEDGNNFGVTVQMTVAKAMKESREILVKKLEGLPTYHSSRADAVEKMGLSKTTCSNTKTTSKVEAKGGKDGDENKESVSSVMEEKTVGSSNDDKRLMLRLNHVVSIDVACYSSMRMGLVEAMDLYLMILDNVEKNMEKLESPKGNGGGNGHMGMY